MPSLESRQQIARDFIIDVSDRRLELDGARWREAKGAARTEADSVKPSMKWTQDERLVLELEPRLPTAQLDSATMSEMRHQSMACRISQLLHYSVLPLRWEPLNYVAQHRGVATAGGLFATDTHLAGDQGGAQRTFLVSPHEQKLIDHRNMSAACEAKGIKLTVIARLCRLAPGYADFGLCLAGLEGGMIMAQMLLLARRLGLGHSIIVPTEQRPLKNSSDLPIFTLAIDCGGTSPLDEFHADIARVSVPVEGGDDASKLPKVQHLLQVGISPIGALSESVIVNDPETVEPRLFTATMHRSSGRVGLKGTAGASFDQQAIQRLINLASVHHRDVCAPAGDLNLIVSLATIESATGKVALSFLDIAAETAAEHPVSNEVANVVRLACSGEFSLMLTIGAASRDIIDLIASGQILRLYATAGAVGHCLCLAAAEIGAIARPYRAMDDHMMNLLLPLEKRGLLQILVGFDSRPNPAFPLS
jgi:hypothetical protein